MLDFLPLRGLDAGVVEESWPCEVRAFWVKDMQPFVSFVRFIYAYFTLFVVIIGLHCHFLLFVIIYRFQAGRPGLRYIKSLQIVD